MSLDGNVGGISVQGSGNARQEDVGETGSITSTAFNRKLRVESDVEATEGLKSDQPKSDVPSLRKRITTPVDSSKTRSVRQLVGQAAGKVVDKLVPERLQEEASFLKAKAAKKTHAVAEVVSSGAKALKSATIGKLLRAIRHESFSKVDLKSTQNPDLKGKVEEHNRDVDKLADLKSKLKNEDRGLKEFRNEYKEALKLLEHPEKFTASSKPVMMTIPGGETRTINAGDIATRTKMVEMIKADIMNTPEYQAYEHKMAQKATGGTELFLERQELKQKMKGRAESMVEMFRKEVSEDLDEDMASVRDRKKAFAQEHTQKVSERGAQYDQRTKEAKARMTAKEQAVADLKEERADIRDVISDSRNTKKKLKRDAIDLRSTAERMGSVTGKSQVDESAEVVEKEYNRFKNGVSKAKNRLSEIPEELRVERKARKEARKEFEELNSGKAREQDIKASAEEWEAKEKEFSKEEKQMERAAKKKARNFKKGLG